VKVAALWRYPVKSLQGTEVQELELGFAGVAGDRRWALLRDGKPLSAKRVPELLLASARDEDGEVVIILPDGTRTGSTDPDVNAVLGRWLGEPVALVAHTRAPWVDDAPVHLLTTASLDASRAEHAGDWDPRRFRPNVVVDSDGPGRPEESWLGRQVQVGGARLQVRMRTVRCAMTTHPQPGLGGDPQVLATLARVSDTALGVYAAVMSAGTVRTGDRVQV
jgi:uncharacterized protein